MTNIVILGSTGSIGTQTLDVIRRMPDRFRVVGLAANRSVEMLERQAREWGVGHVAVADEPAAAELHRRVSGAGIAVASGVLGLCEVASMAEADVVVVAVAGAIGIAPTHAAIRAGKTIALASKEVLVAAGEETMLLAREAGVAILPIDSEHSALFQCLADKDPATVEKLIITASGGPFRTMPAERFASITPEQALKHPTWTMGGLVTINSATLMNKGLEIIEARWLFDVPASRIDLLVHPQSIIHSLVQFADGSVLAQLGLPDMRLPIQVALTHPERVQTHLPRLDLAQTTGLTFEAVDYARFPAPRVALAALGAGGTMPAVMNAANEEAVALFLERRIAYTGIMDTVQSVMDLHTPCAASLEAVLEADSWARRAARSAGGA